MPSASRAIWGAGAADHFPLAIEDRRAGRAFFGVGFIGQIGHVFVTIDEEVVLQDHLLGLPVGVLYDIDGLAFVDLAEITSKAIVAEIVKRDWGGLDATRLDSDEGIVELVPGTREQEGLRLQAKGGDGLHQSVELLLEIELSQRGRGDLGERGQADVRPVEHVKVGEQQARGDQETGARHFAAGGVPGSDAGDGAAEFSAAGEEPYGQEIGTADEALEFAFGDRTELVDDASTEFVSNASDFEILFDERVLQQAIDAGLYLLCLIEVADSASADMLADGGPLAITWRPGVGWPLHRLVVSLPWLESLERDVADAVQSLAGHAVGAFEPRGGLEIDLRGREIGEIKTGAGLNLFDRDLEGVGVEAFEAVDEFLLVEQVGADGQGAVCPGHGGNLPEVEGETDAAVERIVFGQHGTGKDGQLFALGSGFVEEIIFDALPRFIALVKVSVLGRAVGEVEGIVVGNEGFVVGAPGRIQAADEVATVKGVPSVEVFADLFGFGDARIKVPAVTGTSGRAATGAINVDSGVVGQLSAAVHNDGEVMIGKHSIVFRRPGHTVFGSIATLFVGEGWEWYVDAEEVRDVTFAVSVVGSISTRSRRRCRLGGSGGSDSSGWSRAPRGDGNTQRNFND